jgi:hypothetical protein
MKTKLHWVFTMLALLVIGGGAHAANIIWTNTAGGNWSDATSWNPNQVPGSGDAAIITNAGNYSVTLDISPTVGGLVLGRSSGLQTFLMNGQTLTLDGQMTINSSGSFVLDSGVLTGNGTISGPWT